MARRAFAASDAEWAHHGGEFVRLGDVRLSPATHGLNYGTGVFEGIRAYWNEQRGTLQVLKLREHYERFEKSCRILHMELPHTIDELCDITLEILRRNAPREDTYIRPLAYKAVESVGVNLRGHPKLSIFTGSAGPAAQQPGLTRVSLKLTTLAAVIQPKSSPNGSATNHRSARPKTPCSERTRRR
jgi:branched-chain amino acid aminotransferase